MGAQPVVMPGSVDSRSWLMANRSMSCAHAPETDDATNTSAVPEIHLASITLASPVSFHGTPRVRRRAGLPRSNGAREGATVSCPRGGRAGFFRNYRRYAPSGQEAKVLEST